MYRIKGTSPTYSHILLLIPIFSDWLQQLKQPLTADELRLCLRQFEANLFNELGFALTLKHDSLDQAIELETWYRFLPDMGLVLIVHNDDIAVTQNIFKGNEILSMAEQGLSTSNLNAWSRLHRQLIDHLLDYQPLQSRLLWQQQQRYQS